VKTMAQKRRNPPTAIGGSETICEQRTADHRRQVAPKSSRTQVARRRAVKPPPVPERWWITRELAALRGAARVVAGYYQRLGATFKMVSIHEDAPGVWRESISGSSESLVTDAKVHSAGLVAETLFWQQPPIEYRDDDYDRIRTVASCIKYSNRKLTLSEITERVLRETFHVLVREYKPVALVAHALLGRLDGDEISHILTRGVAAAAIDDLPIDASVAHQKLEAVLAQHPLLSVNGFERTSSMPFNLRRFALAYLFCMRIEKVKAINRRRTSYGLKHIAERFYGTYTTNGEFIAAAIAAGFKYRQCQYADLNAQFNMSERSIKALLSERTAT
jgi:hypothetical protein